MVIRGKDAMRILEAMKLNEPVSANRLRWLEQCAEESILAEQRGKVNEKTTKR